MPFTAIQNLLQISLKVTDIVSRGELSFLLYGREVKRIILGRSVGKIKIIIIILSFSIGASRKKNIHHQGYLWTVVVLEIAGCDLRRDPCLNFFINQIILQVVFRQSSNASKLCSVASDESFATFLDINELCRKVSSFFSANMCLKCFGFWGKPCKNKKHGVHSYFPRGLIKISNY